VDESQSCSNNQNGNEFVSPEFCPYQRVGTNVRLSQFSGLRHDPDIMSDVIGLTIDGQIDMVEIVSPSQTRAYLTRKLENARKQMPPEKRGGILVLDPKDAVK